MSGASDERVPEAATGSVAAVGVPAVRPVGEAGPTGSLGALAHGADLDPDCVHGRDFASAPVVLRLRDAAFRHPGGAGIGDLHFDVHEGEAVALIGPNGAGKSTLITGILGLVPLVAGAMDAGAEGTRTDHGHVGYLPQTADVDLGFPITLEQVVMQGRYRRLGWFRWPGKCDRQVVRDAIAAVDLAEHATTPFGALSGGQRQRGFIARAFAAEPRLLLLDEPFNGLDRPNREALLRTIRFLTARGVAVIVSTHDLDLAREACDSVLLLNGSQFAFGPTATTLTLGNVQRCFEDVGVELDEHTLVVPDHHGQ
ncbi:metal ABC transporter ATP-binding protein [Agromyces seonyuensis]|uniref:ATP-binding cassette domain-containing protein n=1 Tax=Agromyces seonyuensis TaxID=2662446 RepID=A0A6I4P0G4_9MICO|nr:metal ABC transporter ATP-binding protein [Agromyces seonyuensis]MWB98225.1 ATP-binding cassette domain-containing protein [Agromyces seonyuensis]